MVRHFDDIPCEGWVMSKFDDSYKFTIDDSDREFLLQKDEHRDTWMIVTYTPQDGFFVIDSDTNKGEAYRSLIEVINDD